MSANKPDPCDEAEARTCDTCRHDDCPGWEGKA